jgi:hypothetical protein
MHFKAADAKIPSLAVWKKALIDMAAACSSMAGASREGRYSTLKRSHRV